MTRYDIFRPESIDEAPDGKWIKVEDLPDNMSEALDYISRLENLARNVIREIDERNSITPAEHAAIEALRSEVG